MCCNYEENISNTSGIEFRLISKITSYYWRQYFLPIAIKGNRPDLQQHPLACTEYRQISETLMALVIKYYQQCW